MADFSRIRIACKEKNISLVELSEEIGISANGIQKIINTNRTTVDTLEKICKVLKVPISYFFEETQIPNVLNNQIGTNIVKGTSAGLIINRGTITGGNNTPTDNKDHQIEILQQKIEGLEKENQLLKQQIEFQTQMIEFFKSKG